MWRPYIFSLFLSVATVGGGAPSSRQPTRDVTIHQKWQIVDSGFIPLVQKSIAIQWIDSLLNQFWCKKVGMLSQFSSSLTHNVICSGLFCRFMVSYGSFGWIDSLAKKNRWFSIHLVIGILTRFSIHWIVNRDVPTANSYSFVLCCFLSFYSTVNPLNNSNPICWSVCLCKKVTRLPDQRPRGSECEEGRPRKDSIPPG